MPPTNEAWLDPWYTYLADRGVLISAGANVTSIETRNGCISGVTYTRNGAVMRAGCPRTISSWPCHWSARPTWCPKTCWHWHRRCNIIKLAPNVEWMNGIQFYLNTEVNLNKGRTMYTGSNWA